MTCLDCCFILSLSLSLYIYIYIYIAKPQNELTALYNTKSTEGQHNCTKYRETILKCALYNYTNNQQPKANSARLTRDTASKLTHFKPLTVKKEMKKSETVFFCSLNKIQTIQLTLSSIHTQDETWFYWKAMRKRCVFSWDFKDDKDGQRWIFKGSEFQTSGAWYWKDRAPALFRLTLGTVRSFWEDEGRDLEDMYEDRQQER